MYIAISEMCAKPFLLLTDVGCSDLLLAIMRGKDSTGYQCFKIIIQGVYMHTS